MKTFIQFIMEEWKGGIKYSSGADGHEYIKAYDGDKEVGSLEYKHKPKENRIDVWMVQTHPDYRRKGVATAIMDAVRSKHPDSKLDWGTKTFDGLKFVRKYDPKSMEDN